MRRIAVLLLIITVLGLAGCGFLRDTATPSSRLQGHWFSDAAVDYYFGPVQVSSGEGSLIIVPEGGERVDQIYRIVSEDVDQGLITVVFEGQVEQEITLYIPEDGIFMQERDEGSLEDPMDYTFIDTRIEPLSSEDQE